MKKYDMRLTDIAFKNLIVHIVIILKRSFHERRVDYEEAEIRQLESDMEFAAAKEVLAVIYHKLHIDITDEVYYLTQHLISSKKFLTTNFTDENEEYEFKKEIQAILYRIREDTNVDLSDDTQLINGLAV
ncbi:PRD domain-containing protein, partial [[Clostridium] scindens]|uniref:PRD domain-containing protein n=1 Tax=Clostridium scindens (strain JCM 10418 / VPI 12708) TaxID=29347 RepID=UPI001D073D4F